MWRGILGHDDVVERFRRSIRARRLASTYLFVGPEGIGKRRFGRELAKTVLCHSPAEADFVPCDACESCRLFDAGNHPDFEQIGLLPEKSELAIAQFVGDDEHRNQEGLCHRISLRPFLGGRRVAVIDDADHFNAASANCLLKTLEEPPPHSLLILIGTSLGRQLPTIRSRAQIVQFRALSTSEVCEILLAEDITADPQMAAELAASSDGSVAQARHLADPELWAFRASLLQRIAKRGWDIASVEKLVLDFVQAAGTEASLRRERLRNVIGLVIDHYRKQLKIQASRRGPSDESLSTPSRAPSGWLPALDACLAAVEQVDRNANQSLVVGQWLASLAGFTGSLPRISA
jgi:DNA polymerase-3 subunit delta'